MLNWLIRSPLNAGVLGWTITMLATALYVTVRNMKLKDSNDEDQKSDDVGQTKRQR